MVTKIKFQPNCYNFLKFRAVYTVVVIICAIIPLIFLIDPIALPSQISQSNTEACQNSTYGDRKGFLVLKYNASAEEVDEQTGEITELDTGLKNLQVKGPMGITKVDASYGYARPSQMVCEIIGDQNPVQQIDNLLVFRSNESIDFNRTGSREYRIFRDVRIKVNPEDTVYKGFTDVTGQPVSFRAYDNEFFDNLSSQRTVAVAFLAIIVVIAVIVIVFIWFSCEGWCDCESPWKSAEQTVGGDMFV